MFKVTKQGSDRAGIKFEQISREAAREKLACSASRLLMTGGPGEGFILPPPHKASKAVPDILHFGAHLDFVPCESNGGTRSQCKLGERTCFNESCMPLIFHFFLLYFRGNLAVVFLSSNSTSLQWL